MAEATFGNGSRWCIREIHRQPVARGLVPRCLTACPIGPGGGQAPALRSSGRLTECTTKRGVLALFSVLALLLVACEYPGVPHPLVAAAPIESGSAPGSAARRESPLASAPKVAPSAKGGQGTGVLQGTVRVAQKDFELEPSSITVKAGAITFVLQNEGRYTHDFRVEGEGIDEKGPKVGAGRRLEWRITLKPGEYRISCPVSNHADRGMVGTLAVVQ